jgi:transcription elongation factor B subunit 1
VPRLCYTYLPQRENNDKLTVFFLGLGKFSEALTGRCVFENLSGVVLEKVCEYFCYNEKNKNQANVPDMDIPPELCLELLMAADYLDT